jgi:DNA/RNA-binding protein KIN17
MGKNDFASPKAIANRIKAKGLQKLKFFCQLCNKQCRDENGFKCHLSSEAHLRQMEVFGQNPRKVIEDYSSQFLKSFLEHLKRTHPFSRVEANHVYNDFISDREHVHMNATKWLSLTDFVKWLGREGICKVDETDKGWFIKLVREEDPSERKRREREEAEKESDERHLKVLQAQAARAKKARLVSGDDDNDEGDGSIVELDKVKEVIVKVNEDRRVVKERVIESKEVFTTGDATAGPSSNGNARKARPKSNVELLMERELAKKKAAHAYQTQQGAGKLEGVDVADGNQQRPWLCENIVVKVLSQSLKDHGYYKKKGVVTKVMDGGFVAEIEMFDGGDVVRVDQEELETVVPGIGRPVMVVKGFMRGKKGTLMSIDEVRYGALVGGLGGAGDKENVFLEYEFFSKWAG